MKDENREERTKYFYLIFFVSLLTNGITDNWLGLGWDHSISENFIHSLISTIKLALIFLIIDGVIWRIRLRSK